MRLFLYLGRMSNICQVSQQLYHQQILLPIFQQPSANRYIIMLLLNNMEYWMTKWNVKLHADHLIIPSSWSISWVFTADQCTIHRTPIIAIQVHANTILCLIREIILILPNGCVTFPKSIFYCFYCDVSTPGFSWIIWWWNKEGLTDLKTELQTYL